ncbi:putative lipoprotein [Candidatus Magnetominusculus xianensis]|uniref:Lipoprotein n=2 Tax=Candidatus Magnetominusculus xianensis TaxID=1748249 RepID=A0ABR5SB72_9BACT|nr:putative lipoprotein [Candidatus Magnetominusculus xianensis]MBF0404886.1 carboxypeptidase-like regulatory domain-containing protein [Nitrospirota bacterium]
MIKRLIQPVVIAVLVVLGVYSASFAYEGGALKGGADVKGVVKYSGTPPKEEPVRIGKDEAVCGKEQKPGAYVVSTDKGVKNAVVWLEGVENGKPLPKQDVGISIKGCKIEPLVNVGFVGGDYVIKNEDTILHTVQLKLGLQYHNSMSSRPLIDGSTILNLALPNKDEVINKPIRRYHKLTKDTGYISVKSNTHDWMRGYVFVFDQPYAVVTDNSGKFELTNVPPGDYILKVWHEGTGTYEQKIKVSAETKPIEIDITVTGKTAGDDAAPSTSGKAQASFNETAFDFGPVKWGQTVVHTFELINTGTEKLIIKNLIPA